MLSNKQQVIKDTDQAGTGNGLRFFCVDHLFSPRKSLNLKIKRC